LPEHGPPLHATNVDPDAGVAVSVTIVPLLKLAAQVAPQLMDPSLLATVPIPEPCFMTVRSEVAGRTVSGAGGAVLWL